MQEKRDQRIVKSEKAIIDAAIRVFTNNPAAGVSDIAAASGVGRTTLYRHFESREALVAAITLHCFEEVEEALQPVHELQGREAIEATFACLIPVANRYRCLNTLWPEVHNDPRIADKTRQSSQEMEWLVDQAKKSGEIDTSLPSVWLATLFEMTLYAAWSLLDSGDISADQAAQLAARSFFNGCTSGK